MLIAKITTIVIGKCIYLHIRHIKDLRIEGLERNETCNN